MIKAPTFTTKKGDTGRPFRIRVYKGARDLTGFSATLTVWKDGEEENKIDGEAMTLTDQTVKANWGWFEYYPAEEEIDVGEKYCAEVEVTRPDGKSFHLPADDEISPSQPYYNFIVLESRS